jgi:U3 small nucleolar RNA-associated protein 25
MTSSFATPQLNAAFARLCASHAGKFRLVPQPSGVLGQVVPQVRATCACAVAGVRAIGAARAALTVQVRQLFERFETPSPAAAADARLATFKASLWPRLTEGGGGGGLLLVVPSYFDFVRLR